MNFINRLFKPKVQCPRCLGKGDVGNNDIKRLNKELKWKPGQCAYCNGSGIVSFRLIERVKPDTTYLTTHLDPKERNSLFTQQWDAVQRANQYDIAADNLIKQIEYLYFAGNMKVQGIVDFFFIAIPVTHMTIREKEDFTGYVQRVIEKHKTS